VANHWQNFYENEITVYDKHLLVKLPDGSMNVAEKVDPMPRERMICFNCRTMLEYVVGTGHV
jgi:hypothetical protein